MATAGTSSVERDAEGPILAAGGGEVLTARVIPQHDQRLERDYEDDDDGYPEEGRCEAEPGCSIICCHGQKCTPAFALRGRRDGGGVDKR